jgi:hypothetical protein
VSVAAGGIVGAGVSVWVANGSGVSVGPAGVAVSVGSAVSVGRAVSVGATEGVAVGTTTLAVRDGATVVTVG